MSVLTRVSEEGRCRVDPARWRTSKEAMNNDLLTSVEDLRTGRLLIKVRTNGLYRVVCLAKMERTEQPLLVLRDEATGEIRAGDLKDALSGTFTKFNSR